MSGDGFKSGNRVAQEVEIRLGFCLGMHEMGLTYLGVQRRRHENFNP
jgi:hypothetical protein